MIKKPTRVTIKDTIYKIKINQIGEIMNIKSLYIAASEKNVGMLFVSMGMMEVLRKDFHRVAFFRPIVASKDVRDHDIEFMLEKYELDQTYDEACGFDLEYVEFMIASKLEDELLNKMIEKFKQLEEKYDFVLCEGIRRSSLRTVTDYDLNVKLAQNFGSAFINIINAKERSTQEIYENIMIEKEHITKSGTKHFTTFVNRLDEKKLQMLQERLTAEELSVTLLREIKELDMPTMEDIVEALDAEKISFKDDDNSRIIKQFKIAALSVNHYLDYIEEGDFVIVAADRSDIILALMCSLYSREYPKISGIVFPFGMKPHANIQKLMDGLKRLNIPILSVKDDTYQTAAKLQKVYAKLRVNSERKIALALGLFHASIDTKRFEETLVNQKSEILTPKMFEYRLFESARENKQRIILPESKDERVLRAAEIILRRNVADIILLGDEQKVEEHYLSLGLDLSEATIINPLTSSLKQEFVKEFYELRKEKGMTMQGAEEAMLKANYFATMMVYLNHADGMVSGAISSTADTLRPALQIVKTTKDVSIVSSVFFMCLETEVLVYGDCAINQDPNAEQLAQIALSSAQTAESFGIEPRVAMLSYSTGESGSGAEVAKVRSATEIVRQKSPSLLVEGPIQYDAAIDIDVAKTKLPDSKVAGHATVFIFPDLNTGNNTYKAVQRSSGAIAIGPVLQGLNKAINDLSRGCSVADIVNTVAITAIQAGRKG